MFSENRRWKALLVHPILDRKVSKRSWVSDVSTIFVGEGDVLSVLWGVGVEVLRLVDVVTSGLKGGVWSLFVTGADVYLNSVPVWSWEETDVFVYVLLSQVDKSEVLNTGGGGLVGERCCYCLMWWSGGGDCACLTIIVGDQGGVCSMIGGGGNLVPVNTLGVWW